MSVSELRPIAIERAPLDAPASVAGSTTRAAVAEESRASIRKRYLAKRAILKARGIKDPSAAVIGRLLGIPKLTARNIGNNAYRNLPYVDGGSRRYAYQKLRRNGLSRYEIMLAMELHP